MSTVSRHRFQAGDVLFWSRRAFLRASTVGLSAMAASARGSEPGDNKTACIVFFLDGGPSHLVDTFDVKPEAPAEVRGQFSAIDTSVPGIRISDQLPLPATQAEHFALVRSIYHGNPSHAPAEHQMLTGCHRLPVRVTFDGKLEGKRFAVGSGAFSGLFLTVCRKRGVALQRRCQDHTSLRACTRLRTGAGMSVGDFGERG